MLELNVTIQCFDGQFTFINYLKGQKLMRRYNAESYNRRKGQTKQILRSSISYDKIITITLKLKPQYPHRIICICSGETNQENISRFNSLHSTFYACVILFLVKTQHKIYMFLFLKLPLRIRYISVEIKYNLTANAEVSAFLSS